MSEGYQQAQYLATQKALAQQNALEQSRFQSKPAVITPTTTKSTATLSPATGSEAQLFAAGAGSTATRKAAIQEAILKTKMTPSQYTHLQEIRSQSVNVSNVKPNIALEIQTVVKPPSSQPIKQNTQRFFTDAPGMESYVDKLTIPAQNNEPQSGIIDTVLESGSTYLGELGKTVEAGAKEAKLSGNNIAAGVGASSAIGIGVSKAVYDAYTYLLRPKAWKGEAGNINVKENPLVTAGYTAGELVLLAIAAKDIWNIWKNRKTSVKIEYPDSYKGTESTGYKYNAKKSFDSGKITLPEKYKGSMSFEPAYDAKIGMETKRITLPDKYRSLMKPDAKYDVESIAGKYIGDFSRDIPPPSAFEGTQQVGNVYKLKPEAGKYYFRSYKAKIPVVEEDWGSVGAKLVKTEGQSGWTGGNIYKHGTGEGKILKRTGGDAILQNAILDLDTPTTDVEIFHVVRNPITFDTELTKINKFVKLPGGGIKVTGPVRNPFSFEGMPLRNIYDVASETYLDVKLLKNSGILPTLTSIGATGSLLKGNDLLAQAGESLTRVEPVSIVANLLKTDITPVSILDTTTQQVIDTIQESQTRQITDTIQDVQTIQDTQQIQDTKQIQINDVINVLDDKHDKPIPIPTPNIIEIPKPIIDEPPPPEPPPPKKPVPEPPTPKPPEPKPPKPKPPTPTTPKYIPKLPEPKAPNDKDYSDKPTKNIMQFKVIYTFKDKKKEEIIKSRTFRDALYKTWSKRGSSEIPKKVSITKIIDKK